MQIQLRQQVAHRRRASRNQAAPGSQTAPPSPAPAAAAPGSSRCPASTDAAAPGHFDTPARRPQARADPTCPALDPLPCLRLQCLPRHCLPPLSGCVTSSHAGSLLSEPSAHYLIPRRLPPLTCTHLLSVAHGRPAAEGVLLRVSATACGRDLRAGFLAGADGDVLGVPSASLRVAGGGAAADQLRQ